MMNQEMRRCWGGYQIFNLVEPGQRSQDDGQQVTFIVEYIMLPINGERHAGTFVARQDCAPRLAP